MKDINRSLNSYDICKLWDQEEKVKMRERLTTIITAVLNKNPDLFYYQGFYDLVSVFLLTLGENLGFQCSNILSNYMISDFLNESFESGLFPVLDFSVKLIQIMDQDIYNLIDESGGQPSFALSWILTWFSHDIDKFDKV